MKALREEGPVKRTTLATRVGLSYDSLARYVEWMSGRGFLDMDDDGILHLTEEGQEVYERLVKRILEYVGKVRFPRFED